MITESALNSLQLANPWWKKEPIPEQYKLPYKRPQLKTIIAYEKLNRIVVIKGPRRTGKTTLIYQYIDQLLTKGINPNRILFASMDDLNLRMPLQDLLDAYKNAVESSSEPGKRYVFLDEIQFLDDWSVMAKVITDRDKLIRLVVSGSSASLMVKSSESLAGRTVEEVILPFTVRETIQSKQSSKERQLAGWLDKYPVRKLDKLKFNPQTAVYKSQLERFTQIYLKRGGFPHLLNVKNQTLWIDLLRTDIVQKAIYKDLAELYSIKEALILEKLFLYLVEATAGIANLSSISTQLKLSRETVSRYIYYLSNAFLIFPLPKYSRFPKEILRSQEKFHIIDPALSWLSARQGQEQILESTVASLLLHRKGVNLYYWRRNYEVDCIVDDGKSLIPFEVTTSRNPFTSSKYRGLLNFMERYGIKLGFVIYNGEAAEIKTNVGIVRMLPVWFALPFLA